MTFLSSLWDFIWLLFWTFAFVACLFAIFAIIGDLFRDNKRNGWWKALWIIFLIFVPFLTALIYLIGRGHGMRDRSIKEQADVRKHFESYVRETAGTTPVDELHKLNDLKEKGAITDEEFQRMKAKLVG